MREHITIPEVETGQFFPTSWTEQGVFSQDKFIDWLCKPMYKDEAHKERAKELLEELGQLGMVSQESIDAMKREIDESHVE